MMNQRSLASRQTAARTPSGSSQLNNLAREMLPRHGPIQYGDGAHAPPLMRTIQSMIQSVNAEAYESVVAGLASMAPQPVRAAFRLALNQYLDHEILRDYNTALGHLCGILPRSIAFTLALASALANAYARRDRTTPAHAREAPSSPAHAREASASVWVNDTASAGANVRPRMREFVPDAVEMRSHRPQAQDISGEQNHLADANTHAPACPCPDLSLANRYSAVCTIVRTSHHTPAITIGLIALVCIALCILAVHHVSGILDMHTRPDALSQDEVITTPAPLDSWYNP